MKASEEVALSSIGPFVPFPSKLLDEEMPRLKDSEWKLLCAVVRQTIGRPQGQGRKRRDWMSQSQLKKRTGRSNASVSRALDALVRRNLVVCCAEDGTLLDTPAKRRRQRARLYYALAPRLFEQSGRKREPERKRPELARAFTGWEKAGAFVDKRRGGNSALPP